MDQGREVFAVPGNITSKMSWGPNLLIKQGAKLVQDWNDVVVGLPLEVRRQLIDARVVAVAGRAAGDPQAIDSGSCRVSEVGRWALARLKVDAATHTR